MTHARHREQARPLLSAPARRLAGIVLACAVLLLAGGAVFVHEQYADPLDRQVGLWAAARLAGYGGAVRLGSDLGQKADILVISAVLVVACLAARRVNGAVLATVSAPAASVATDKVLKPLAGHLYTYATYPSGHTTAFFALVATTAVLLAARPAGPARRALRFTIVIAAVMIGCAMSLAVIGSGDHRPIDTVGGAAVGISVVLIGAFLLDLPVSRSLLGRVDLGQQIRPATRTSSG